MKPLILRALLAVWLGVVLGLALSLAPALGSREQAAKPPATGVEGELEFWGASFVADPTGNVLARAGHDTEEVLLVECDLAQIEAARTHWPFLRDRRIDAYEGLLKRYLD